MGSTARPKSFAGIQPKWAGEEPSVKVDGKEFFATLMKESPAEQMATRGYAIVRLSPEIMRTYNEFYDSLALFCKQPLDQKALFAQMKNATKMDNSRFSPNQFHGYSQMEGLKEQFMIRAPGRDTGLYLPGEVGPQRNFADSALRLYEQLDQLGRLHLHSVATHIGLLPEVIDRVLDPVNALGSAPHLDAPDASMGVRSATDYVHPGFVSTSILDVFHYFNNFRAETPDVEDRFHNNHASHTDSGIATIVPTADEPGLEVLDQKLGHWIHIENVVHEAVGTGHHRLYACVFFGDSCEYVSKERTKPLFHRVARCQRERYSIVFKMRTAPIVTAPRYQEDYVLAYQQMRAMDAVYARTLTRQLLAAGAITLGLALAAAAYYKLRPALTSKN